MKRCDCGRRVTYVVRPSKRRGSAFRGHGDADHCLCAQCYRDARNKLRHAPHRLPLQMTPTEEDVLHRA